MIVSQDVDIRGVFLTRAVKATRKLLVRAAAGNDVSMNVFEKIEITL